MFVIDMNSPQAKAAMKSLLDELRSNAEFRVNTMKRVGQLSYYSWKDPTEGMDPDREAFLTSNPVDRAAIVALGEALNEEGGLYLMRLVAEIAHGQFKGPSDLRTLDFAWDGIGDWRC